MSAAIFNHTSINMLSDAPRARKPSGRLSNLLMAGVIATGATMALFLTMEYLIRIDKIELAEASDFTLRRVVAEDPTVDTPRVKQGPITPIKTVIPPPAEPLQLPIPEAPGGWDVTIEPVKPNPVSSIPKITTTTYHGPSTAIPIRQPMPVYPRAAQSKGLSGTCQVAFSLNAQGQPYGIAATCSDAVFVSSAERAVRKATFSPTKNAAGVPIATNNMVFPLEYRMD